MSDKANQGEVSFEVLHDRFEQSHRLVLIESVIAQMRPIVYHGDLVSGNGRRLQRPSRYFMLLWKDSDTRSNHCLAEIRREFLQKGSD
jgi:hypothetical protein